MSVAIAVSTPANRAPAAVRSVCTTKPMSRKKARVVTTPAEITPGAGAWTTSPSRLAGTWTCCPAIGRRATKGVPDTGLEASATPPTAGGETVARTRMVWQVFGHTEEAVPAGFHPRAAAFRPGATSQPGHERRQDPTMGDGRWHRVLHMTHTRPVFLQAASWPSRTFGIRPVGVRCPTQAPAVFAAASRSGTVTNSNPRARRPLIIAGRPRMPTRRSRWPVSWASRIVPGSHESTM